jgi:hypothetical protein
VEIVITRAPEVTTHGLAQLTERELVAKARIAMVSAKEATGQEAPEGAVFVGARLLRSGDVVLIMNTAQAADWQRARMEPFLHAMGGTSAFKQRNPTIVLQFVPTTFDPSRDGAVRVVEDDNGLGRGAITNAHFIKPATHRRSGQRLAHAIVSFKEVVTANRVIRDGLFVDGKKVWGRKILSEPTRCVKCQMVGVDHIAATCKSIHDTCARCGEMHRTAECVVPDGARACANCRGAGVQHHGHGAADRNCPVFANKLQHALERNPDARFKFS